MEEFFKTKKLNSDDLSSLTTLTKKQVLLEGDKDDNEKTFLINVIEEKMSHISLKTIEEVLKFFKEKHRKLSQEIIPAVLSECGLSEIKLDTGQKITVQNKIKASITDKNKINAFNEMVEQRMKEYEISKKEAEKQIKDLFKEKLIIDTNINDKLKNFLIDNDIIYDRKLDIHYQTLNKYCKEQREKGYLIPKNINVFEYKETKIK